jgi:aspartyl protease
VSARFEPRRGLIRVDAELSGPERIVVARMLLDTGSFLTMLRPGLLARAGYELASAQSSVPIVGVTGSATAPLWVVHGLTALDTDRMNLGVLGYSFPAAFPFDGLLGANFLRGTRLLIDYHRGIVELSPP